MKTFKTLIAFLLISRTWAGAQELSHIQFTVKDGLPGSAIYQSLQDKSGFIWFCTDQGVSRFDGRTFRNFSKKDGLPDNEIVKLYQDSRGNIWLISLKGTPSVFYNGSILSMDSCKGVYAISEDARTGDIFLLSNFVDTNTSWVGYYRSVNTPGHWRFTPALVTLENEVGSKGLGMPRASWNKKLNFYFDYDRPGFGKLGIESSHGTVWHPFPYIPSLIFIPIDRRAFFSLLPDQGSIVFFTDTFYFGNSERLEKIMVLSELGMQRMDINEIYAENDSTLWICSRNRGLILVSNFLQPKMRKIHSYFPEAFVTSIRKDREGGYWVTTHDDGVYYIPNVGVRYVTAGGEFVGKDIKCIRTIDDHTLAAGLSNGHIVFVNSTGAEVRSFMPWDKVNKNNRLLDIEPLGHDRFAIASDHGLSIFSPTGGIRQLVGDKSAKAVRYLRDIGLVCAAPEGLFRIEGDSRESLYNKRTTCVNGIGNTYYWGTLNGLYSRDGKEVRYWGKETPLLTGIINHIDIAADSSVWVSTQQGIVILKDHRSFSIGAAQGLYSDMCKNVSIAGSVAWVSTDKGISRISLNWNGAEPTYTISHITEDDGLMSNAVNQIALAGGYVWAATARGLSFFPMSYIPHSTQEPLIHINNPDVANLDYQHNKLIIELSGISFRSGKELTYQYRLKDLDSNWIATRNSRLEFSTLPYGVHTFEARVIDRWGVMSSQAKSITIALSPPFWKTLWFTALLYLLAVLLTIAGIYAYFKWRHDKKNQAFELKSKMADLEMMALRAQMNPHFIFNCLSSIQDYILGADVRNANLYLHKLSALIRKILLHSPNSYATLKEELSVLGLYMELEKLRLAHRMEYSIDVADDLRPSDILIPSLLLQPFAENAIQHGISPLQDRRGVIRIDFRRSDKHLVCTIEDNGIGIHASQRERPREEHTSMGLNIISNRIRILNAIRKETIFMDVTDKSRDGAQEQGTIVRIYFAQ